MLIAGCNRPPEAIIAYEALPPSKTEVDAANYKELSDRLKLIEWHQEVVTEHGERKTHYMRRQTQRYDKFHGNYIIFLRSVEESESNLDGHIVRISIAERRTQLTPGQWNLCSVPRAQQEQEHESLKIEKSRKYWKWRALSRPNLNLASLVIFAPKKDGSIRFCVD